MKRLAIAIGLVTGLATAGCEQRPPFAPTVVPAVPDRDLPPTLFKGPGEDSRPKPSTEWVNLNFWIKDACTEQPLRDVQVWIRPSWNGDTRFTDGNGLANFGVPKQAEVDFGLRAPGYYGLVVHDYGLGEQDANLRIFLPPDVEPRPCPPRPYVTVADEPGKSVEYQLVAGDSF